MSFKEFLNEKNDIEFFNSVVKAILPKAEILPNTSYRAGQTANEKYAVELINGYPVIIVKNPHQIYEVDQDRIYDMLDHAKLNYSLASGTQDRVKYLGKKYEEDNINTRGMYIVLKK